jgi:hypothetical protein
VSSGGCWRGWARYATSWFLCRCAVLVTLGKLGKAKVGHMPQVVVVVVVVVGLFRDLRGSHNAATATSTRRTYSLLFDWLVTDKRGGLLVGAMCTSTEQIVTVHFSSPDDM